MKKANELPARVRRVIESLRDRDQSLVVVHRVKANCEPETFYIFEPLGKPAPTQSSIDAIESGFLSPCGDGLFDVVLSQTWIFDLSKAALYTDTLMGAVAA